MNKHRTNILFCAALLLAVDYGCGHTPKARRDGPSSGRSVYELAVVDPTVKDRLIEGFYDGTPAWKWTARRFSVSLDIPPPRDAKTTVDLDFTAPDELMKEVKDVTVSARVNGVKAGRHKYTATGRYTLSVEIPPEALKTSPATIEYELDGSVKDSEGRELGVIVVAVSMHHPEATVIDHDAAVELARQGYRQLLAERRAQLPPEKQNELMKLFHDIPVWRQMRFENVQIEKNPLDLWMMQQIIYEQRPEFIIETGTWKGGSALYWAYTLNGMGLDNSRVITMDIQDLTATAAANPLWKKYVTFIKGSSADPQIVADITKRVSGHTVLVTLDSDHSAAHVHKELEAYAPLVTRGSYLVVEDTHMDGVPTQPDFGPGPMAATLLFLKEPAGKDFEQDLSREALIMTFNPGGWLRRK